MVKTRSSRCDTEPPVFARIQRRQHKDQLHDAISELSSAIQDANHYSVCASDNLIGIVLHKDEKIGKTVVSKRFRATESDSSIVKDILVPVSIPATMVESEILESSLEAEECAVSDAIDDFTAVVSVPVAIEELTHHETNLQSEAFDNIDKHNEDKVSSGPDSNEEECFDALSHCSSALSPERRYSPFVTHQRDCESGCSAHFEFEDSDQKAARYDNGKTHCDSFAWLIQPGKVITIDPLDTIPLTSIRRISDFGVLKLEKAFLRPEDGPGMSMGVSHAVPQAVVVEIPVERLHLVQKYLVEKKGISEENAHAISLSQKWYGIVEEAHRRKALVNVSDRHPKRFKRYWWIVLRVNLQPLDVLRAFARARKEFQKRDHVIEFTVYDVLKNLKQCAAELSVREELVERRSKNRGYLKRVADYYCGGVDTANKVTRQLAGVAVVLSWSVIEIMGEIVNKEDPEASKLMDIDASDGRDLDDRVCRNLFTKSTFRGATTFKSVASEHDQINTLQRLDFLAPQMKYKSVTKADLEAQTKKAIAARKEVEKMERMLQGHGWSRDRAAIKQTLLTKTILDEQVEENKNSAELLPELQELWQSQFPLAAELGTAKRSTSTTDTEHALSSNTSKILEASNSKAENPIDDSKTFEERRKYSSEDQSSSEGDCVSRNTEQSVGDQNGSENGSPMNTSAVGDTGSEEVGADGGTDGGAENEEDRELCPLKQLSVRAEKKGWRQFRLPLQKEQLFDFVYADPQQALSATELRQEVWTEFRDPRKIMEFCHIALRPGCYCFVFVLPEEFITWVSAFQKEGMKVITEISYMKFPFIVIPKSGSSRFTRLKELPQACGELAVVARTPGTCPEFNINFGRSYSQIECSHTRKFGIIDNVPRCVNLLRVEKSRSEVRPREGHPDLTSEILEAFCSPTGKVLDPFGGALTTALACISSQRSVWLWRKILTVITLQSKGLRSSAETSFLTRTKLTRNQLKYQVQQILLKKRPSMFTPWVIQRGVRSAVRPQ